VNQKFYSQPKGRCTSEERHTTQSHPTQPSTQAMTQLGGDINIEEWFFEEKQKCDYTLLDECKVSLETWNTVDVMLKVMP
jgi:hypothetical protein